MVGRHRTKQERLSHLVRASDMYLHGYWQHEIAKELGVSVRTVGYDLAKLHKLWEEKAIANHEKMMSRALARIDWLERQAFDQWNESLKGSATITTTYYETDESGEPLPSRAAMRESEDEGQGAIMWWNALARCVEMRIRILERGTPLRIEVGEAGIDWDEAAKRQLEEWGAEPDESDILIEGTTGERDNGRNATD